MRPLRTHSVGKLQRRLAALGFSPGPQDGVLGPMTRTALRQFQASAGLEPDGIAGAATWTALAGRDASTPLLPHSVREAALGAIGALPDGGLAREALCVAYHEVGVVEEPLGSNGGPRVDVYTDSWRAPWCALFCGWCIREAKQTLGLSATKPLAFPPHRALASALKIRAWAEKRGRWERTPRPGDVFVILHPGAAGVDVGRGHVGFVVAVEGKQLLTVEGNADNGVRVRRRPAAHVAGYARWWT
jgi:hypothetical protein